MKVRSATEPKGGWEQAPLPRTGGAPVRAGTKCAAGAGGCQTRLPARDVTSQHVRRRLVPHAAGGVLPWRGRQNAGTPPGQFIPLSHSPHLGSFNTKIDSENGGLAGLLLSSAAEP